MGCRSLQRAEAARDSLVAANPTWKERLSILEIDTASDSSVTAAAKQLQQLVSE